MKKHNYNDIKDKLYTPCIVDILDDMGYRNQGMDYTIRPLVVNNNKIMGKAFTMLACEVYEIPAEPYKNELAALDLLEKGDIMVATTQGSMGSAFFGELMATRCMVRNAVGAVIDGCTRDTAFIERMGFPLFCKGVNPLDSKGRMDVIAYNVPIVCGGVLVKPGDVIYADRDGIAVIPEAIVDEVIDRALQKISMEDVVRKELKSGMSATDVYAKYGVL
ncbi:MAG: RraA family protein [Bacillota bacterium]